MTGAEFKRIRQKLGLSITQMAAALRIRASRDLMKMETDEKPISGPVSLLMELYDEGVIHPDDAGEAG